MSSTQGQQSSTASGLDQFLQPQSMVTPGVLGTVAMFGTNTLCQAFPAIQAVHVALVLSFFFGTVTIMRTPGLLEKAVYYVVNSLIILSMAFGTNSIGAQTTRRVASLDLPITIGSFTLISTAHAQTKGAGESQGFFRPWTLAPRDAPAQPNPAASDTPPKSADVAPYQIVSPITGDCTTVYLPAGDTAAAQKLAASTGSRVAPGACPPR